MTNSTLVFYADGKDYAIDFATTEEATVWASRLDPQDSFMATRVTPAEAAKMLDSDEYNEPDEADENQPEDVEDGEI